MTMYKRKMWPEKVIGRKVGEEINCEPFFNSSVVAVVVVDAMPITPATTSAMQRHSLMVKCSFNT